MADPSPHKDPANLAILREYGLLKTSQCIYRFFGINDPSLGFLCLLRYFSENGRWEKPPVHSQEVDHGSILTHYDLPIHTIPQYGIALGVACPEVVQGAEYTDSLQHPQTRELIQQLLGYPDYRVGITGSRLAGLTRPNSDIDLVVYGPEPFQLGMEIMQMCLARSKGMEPSSTSLNKLRGVCVEEPTCMEIRNISKAVGLIEGRPVKVDIHYSPGFKIIEDSLIIGSLEGDEHTLELTIVDASQRFFFPGYLMCDDGNGASRRLWIRDHVLSFAIPGDRVIVRCRNVVIGADLDLIGYEVLSMIPIRRAAELAHYEARSKDGSAPGMACCIRRIECNREDTLATAVSELLGARFVQTPPSEATLARRLFDEQPFSEAALLFYMSWVKAKRRDFVCSTR